MPTIFSFPYQKGEKNKFEYDENLGYFAVSVLWRVLLEQMDNVTVSKESKLDFLSDVAEEWKDFLANGKIPTKFTDLNIFLTDRLASIPSNHQMADVYFSRAIDATVVINKDFTTVGVYVKFLRFVVWSIVKGKPTNGKGLKVNFAKGQLSTPQIIDDDYFGGFLYGRVQEIDSLPDMNEKQQQKVIEEIVKNEDQFWSSDAGLSLLNDYRLSMTKPIVPKRRFWERVKKALLRFRLHPSD